MKKKLILGIIVILLGLIGWSLVSKNGKHYALLTVEKGTLTQTVSASGKIKSATQADLRFQSSGELAWIGVKEGDRVKKWQTLASLDKKQLEKDLKKKLLTYMGQRWDFEQTQEDYNANGLPLDQVILSPAEKRILEKTQFTLNSSVLDVEISDAVVKLVNLVSPIDGLVTHVEYSTPGVNILYTAPAITVADPGKLIFEANIDELDIGKIYLGQTAKIVLDAYPDETIEGKVDKIGFAAITTSGGGTAFPVEINLIQGENLKYKIGMNGDLDLVSHEEKDALFIPSSTVFYQNGKGYVWKIVDNYLKKQEIKTGLEAGENIQILEGLSEEEKIVKEPSEKMKDGERI